MTEDEIKAMVDKFMPYITGHEVENQRSAVLYLAKEIERTARTRAVDAIRAAASRIDKREF